MYPQILLHSDAVRLSVYSCVRSSVASFFRNAVGGSFFPNVLWG